MTPEQRIDAPKRGWRRAASGRRGRRRDRDVAGADSPAQPGGAGESAGTDVLTGVGDRTSVDDRARCFTRDRRFVHHMVFIVELDRVQMVNDVFGRASGDLVLGAVADRLAATAAKLAGDDGVESTVARLRGDEFLLSVHAESTLNVMLVCDRVERIRLEEVEVDGRRLPLEFSVGFVYAEGSHDLGELMAVADLKLLADRSARTSARQRASDQLAPPVADEPIERPAPEAMIGAPTGSPSSLLAPLTSISPD